MNTHGPAPLPVGWTAADRRALTSIAVQFFVNGAVLASYVPRLPGIRDRLDISLGTIGWIIGIGTLGGLVGSAVVDRAIQRFGTKVVMLGGAIGIVVLLPLVGFATSPWQLVVVLALKAVADVLTDAAMNMQGSRLSARRAVPVMNRLHGAWSVGTVVGGLIATVMAARDVDLRLHLVGTSVVLLAAVIYVRRGLLTDDAPVEDAHPSDSHPSDKRGRHGSGVRSPIWIFAVLGAVAVAPEMVNSDWAAFRLTDDLGASRGLAGLAYVAFTAGMVVGRFAGDSVKAAVGATTLLRWATGVAWAGTAIATMIPLTPTVFAGLFVAALGVSVMFPELYDAAARRAHIGNTFGALTAGSLLSLFAAPALVGALADSSVFNVGASMAVVTMPSMIAVLLLSRRAAGSPEREKAR